MPAPQPTPAPAASSACIGLYCICAGLALLTAGACSGGLWLVGMAFSQLAAGGLLLTGGNPGATVPGRTEHRGRQKHEARHQAGLRATPASGLTARPAPR